MMQDNIDISEFYDNGSISGETYLYCVEHDILNIQDALEKEYNDASEIVITELNEITKQYRNDTAYGDMVTSESSDMADIKDEYTTLLQDKITTLDSTIQKYVDELIVHYGCLSTFASSLISCHGRVDIQNLSSLPVSAVNVVLDLAYDLQSLKRNSSIFDELFAKCSDVRCTNVLKTVYKCYGNKLEFVNWILSCSKSELYKLRNLGEKSIGLIWDIIQELQETSGSAVDFVPKDGVNEVCDKLSIYLITKGYKLPNKLSKDLSAYLRDIIWYYANDLDVFYCNIFQFKRKKDLPFYKNTHDSVLNAFLDLVHDIRNHGKKYSIFDECFYMCNDVRCINVLKAHYRNFGNKLEFIDWLLSCSKVDLMKLQNVGRKSWEILYRLVEDLKEMANENASYEDPLSVTCYTSYDGSTNSEPNTENDLEKFKLLIESKKRSLSVRACNVLDSIIGNTSYDDLLKKFLSSQFCFASAKNCGKKTEKELNQFRDNIISLLSTTSLEYVEEQSRFKKFKSILPFSDDSINDVINLHDELGHLPLFYTIQKYIDSMKGRDHTILHGMVDIYNGQELQSRDDLAKQLNISKERIRQLRGKILMQIHSFIKSLGKAEDLTSYLPNMPEEINRQEGTNFQDNFIYWSISLVNTEWVALGDIEDVFFNPHGHQVNLNIVPASLHKVYRFNNLISEFENLYYEKRTVTVEINLESICLKHFIGSIQIALINDIIYECKKIILRLFDCTSNGNIIILESNAYRGLSEISEEILRENGAPMTAEEIYAVLLTKYPNHRCKGANSLVGSIHNNPNILPMGRSRTFSLKEWNLGTKRGGTIREFAEEYILMQDERIASLEDIGNYVRQFRDTSSNSSIQANLMLESSGKFALYTKDDLKYIGFSGREYDPCYIPAEESMVIVRSFETSTRLLIQFIEANGRFPFSAGEDVDESEKRLWRFLRNVRYRCKQGNGTPEDHEFIKYLESAYPYQEIPRNEYKWRETHSSICNTLQEFGRDSLTTSEQSWCYKHLRLLREGQLEDWQVPLMMKLQSLYA